MPSYVNTKSISLVYGCHRQTMAYTNLYTFRKDLNKQKTLYGNYAHISKSNVKGVVNVIFSDSQGYPIAETLVILGRYEDIDNLVYVESIGGKGGRRIVVVKAGGRIIFESIFTGHRLPDAVLFAMSENDIQYKAIFAAEPSVELGDDGLYEQNLLPRDLISSTEVVESALLTEAKAQIQFPYLRPVWSALDQSKVSQVTRPRLAVAASLLAGLYFFGDFAPEAVKFEEPIFDKYASYRTALNTYSPAGNVLAGLTLIMECDLLAGWEVQSMAMNNTNLYVQLDNKGGRYDALEAWAAYSKKPLRTVNNKMQIYAPIVTKKREFGNHIYYVDDVVKHLRSAMLVVGQGELTLSEATDSQGILKRPVKLQVTSALPQEIVFIAHSLADLPVSLEALKFTKVSNLYSAEISLNIYGIQKASQI